jgi:hypothetical protein
MKEKAEDENENEDEDDGCRLTPTTYYLLPPFQSRDAVPKGCLWQGTEVKNSKNG